MVVSNYVTDKYYGKSEPKASGEEVFGIRTIGASKWVDQSNPDPIKAIQGEIWAGAGHIEITAPGTGRGGRGNSTYEEFDDEQRTAIRELVKINKVNLSVHATPNVQMTGLGREGFSEEQRQRSIDEVKKAIDFSRDASSGGSVVVHTGEFPRPLDVEGWYKGQFQTHSTERDDARFLLVDKESGQLVQSVKANEEVVRAVYAKDNSGNNVFLKDEKGNYVYDDVMVEYYMNKHHTKYWNKVPDEDRNLARIKLTEKDKFGNVKTEQVTFKDFYEAEYKKGRKKDEILVDFYKEQAVGSIQQALGQSRYHENAYKDGLEMREKVSKKLLHYQGLKEKFKDSPDTWAQIKAQFTEEVTGGKGTSEDALDPIAFYADKMGDTQRSILYGQETALGGRKEAKRLLNRLDKVQDIQEFALDKSKRSFAELGIYAMEQTQAARNARKGDEIKDIFVSLENIYPEMGFGSHPEELMKLTDIAREEMAKRLFAEKRIGSEKEAQEIAKKHIKVTFDTGHMNMWRKHFVPKKDAYGREESKEDTDKAFKKWYTDEVTKMAKGGYIGNVHLADNFGYDDTHLAPGHGNTPIAEVLKILKDNGYNEKMAVEGGFNQGKNGYHETWKMVGAHVDTKYARGRDGTDAWLNPNSNFAYMRDHYLGRANRPNFIFKGYSPDSDDWKPWSGLGME